jgi:phosphohistidine phosphatase
MATLTLSFLRHAKSSWADDTLDDFERPLAPRGERAAAAMAVYLRQNRFAPERVLCSPSTRTVQTLAAIRDVLPERLEIVEDRRLYECSGATIMDVLAETSNFVASQLVVCHNPATEEVLGHLLGSSAARRRVSPFPTASFAMLSMEASGWASIEAGSAALTLFATPKSLV